MSITSPRGPCPGELDGGGYTHTGKMSDDDDEVVVVGGLCREVFSNLIIQSGHENVDVVLFERKEKDKKK